MNNGLIVIVILMLVGCASPRPVSSQIPVAFKLAEFNPFPGLNESIINGSNKKVYLRNKAVLTDAHIASAKVAKTEYGPQIEIVFTDEGRNIFAKITRENIGKPLAIIIDDKVISAPVIMAEISGGKAVITGKFSEQEARSIAKRIMGK